MRAGFTLSDPPNEGCRPNAIALAFSGNNRKFVPNENAIEQKLKQEHQHRIKILTTLWREIMPNPKEEEEINLNN